MRDPFTMLRSVDVAELAPGLDGIAAANSERSAAVKAGRLGVVVAVGLATAAWALLAQLTSNLWIFPDELLYSEVAKSLADGDLPAVRGVTSFDYGLLYPLLISPAWLFDDVQTAYSVARAINAAAMALAAVPIFYLARRFTSGRKALLVACFSVAAPSLAYAGTLMTEVALYPAMALAVLAIACAVERPTARSQALALGAIGVAFLVKPIAVVLLAAYPIAVAVYCLGAHDRSARRAALGRYRLTWLALLAGVALAVAGGAALAGDPVALLGAYAVAAGHVDVLGTGRWLVANISALALYVVVIPFAATLAVLMQAWRRGARRELRLFAAVTAPTIVVVVAAVAAFGSEGHAGAEGFSGAATAVRERNLFFVVPLLLIGLAIWTDTRDRAGRGTWVAAGASLALVALYPWGDVPRAANPQNLASLPYLVLPSADWSAVAAVSVAVLALALWRWLPDRKIGYLWITVGTWFVLTGFVAVTVFASAADKTERWRADDPAWIDRVVPEGVAVAVLWSEHGSERYAAVDDRQRVVWLNELYNRSVGTVYELGPKMPYNVPAQRVRAESRAVRTLSGDPVVAPYVLVRCPLTVEGALVAEDVPSGARLYRTDGALRVADARPCTSA
jgi:hypothetical protein